MNVKFGQIYNITGPKPGVLRPEKKLKEREQAAQLFAEQKKAAGIDAEVSRDHFGFESGVPVHTDGAVFVYTNEPPTQEVHQGWHGWLTNALDMLRTYNKAKQLPEFSDAQEQFLQEGVTSHSSLHDALNTIATLESEASLPVAMESIQNP